MRLRRSPRLNKECERPANEEPYSDCLEIFDSNVDFIIKAIKCFGIIPVLYSLYNGFYVHAIVSGSMILFDHHPNFSIMNFNASTVSHRVGLFVYTLSQIVVMSNDNYYIILPLEIGAQYCFLFHTILELKNDKRHLFFKGFMDLFICVTKCTILYYLVLLY